MCQASVTVLGGLRLAQVVGLAVALIALWGLGRLASRTDEAGFRSPQRHHDTKTTKPPLHPPNPGGRFVIRSNINILQDLRRRPVHPRDLLPVRLDDGPCADVPFQLLELREGGPVEQHRIAPLSGVAWRDDRRQGLAVALDERREQFRGNARLVGQEEEDGGGGGAGSGKRGARASNPALTLLLCPSPIRHGDDGESRPAMRPAPVRPPRRW